MLSVIIPAYNAERTLGDCLNSVFASDHPNFEVIVVDDHSSDSTVAKARAMPCKLIEKSVNSGAADARNAGAAAATSSILVFLDADIVIPRDSLRRIEAVFAERSDIAAMFGSYQEDTPPRDFFSQYKNLLHHYTHQTSSPQAKTFASGFGAVRAEVFKALAGFEPGRRYLEDIELGYRMNRAGYRVLLDRQLQMTHCKRYTLPSLVHSDFFARAVPWTRLMLEKRIFQNDLNTKVNNVLSVPISALILAAPLALRFPWIGVAVAVSIVMFVALNHRFLAFLLHKRGLRFALGGAVMTWFAYLYSGLGAIVGLAGHIWDRHIKTRKANVPDSAAVRGRSGDLSS
jgi:glycosyltransferase involved in cell wall biosynthesis